MLTANWRTSSHRVQPIGLDLGCHGLKMVQVAVCDDKLRVLAARKAVVDPEPAGDATRRQKALVAAIRRLLADGQFRGQKVVSALPVDKVRITSVRLPEDETEHVDRALRREAAERFDVDPAASTIHYLPAGSVRQGDEAKNEYILFAVDPRTVEAHLRLLEEAGLTPVAIDAQPCALFRTFERTMRRQADRERTIIFIDVGHQYTTVVFGRGSDPCFVKHIGVGMGQFNDEVAAALGIAAPEAESFRLRLQRDEAIDPDTRRHMVDALNVRSEQLAGEIALCLRYYTVTFRGKRVERAIVAGGGAYEPVLRDALHRHLSVDVEVADPLRGFEFQLDKLDTGGTDGYADLAVAVGLSLKGVDAPVAEEEPAAQEPEPEPAGEGVAS